MRDPRRTAWPLPLLLAAAGLAGDTPEDFYQDFRKGRFRDALFQKVGGDPDRQIRPEERGLRIALPAGEKAWPQTGIAPRFQVRGDFEITMTCEILTLEPPASGYGSGIMLWIQAADNQGTASIALRRRVKQGRGYGTNRTVPQADGPAHNDEQFFPTSAKSGKLRLQRTGETLHYLIAEGAGEDFRELRETPFGTADLTTVRFVADPGGSRSKLDVLIQDVRFHTGELPLRGAEKTSRAWLGWVVAAGVLGAGAVGGFLWRRRKRRQAAPASKGGRAGVKPTPASVAARPVPHKRGHGDGR
jgi:hypothetical protein